MEQIAAMQTTEMFARGNLSALALGGDDQDWQSHAARGLLGLTEAGVEGLARFSHVEARFYAAASHWIGGNEDAAIRDLEPLATAGHVHAQALLALIRRPQIEVLSMLPGNRHGPHVLLAGGQADSKFRLRNISYHPGDLSMQPYAPISRYLEREQEPDFFVCSMIEWHQIPVDFNALSCPTIGTTSDFDLHIQGVLPWFHAFDEIIVTDHTEHAGLWPILRRPVWTFPKVFGCPTELPEPSDISKDIDVFMSGTLFGAYHPDKAALLHELLDIPGLRVLLVNGHLSPSAYYDLLSRSLMTVSYYRRPGGMVTRGIEAAAMGCITLIQAESVLQLFSGKPNGLVPYDSTPAGLRRAVQHVIANRDVVARRAREGIAAIRAACAPEVVGAQFLRFCAVLASRPRRGRPPVAPLVQKRNMFWKGWSPGGGNHSYSNRLCRENVRRMRESPDLAKSAALANDVGRELLLDGCARFVDEPIHSGTSKTVRQALGIFADTVARHPNALVPLFNFVRSALHFGNRKQVKQAINLAKDAVDGDPERWRIAPMDDVLPYDFAGGHFNYRSYIDHLVDILGDAASGEDTLRRLILASLHHYLALCLDDLGHARRAVARDPVFDAYQLDWAMREGLSGAAGVDSVQALVRLVRRSPLAAAAQRVLHMLAARGVEIAELAELDAHMARFGAAVVESEAYASKIRGAYFRSQILGKDGARGFLVRHAGRRSGRVRLTAVLLARTAPGCRSAALKALAHQTLARADYRIVHVEPSAIRTDDVLKEADTAVACGQEASLMHMHAAINVGLLHADGAVCVIVDDAVPVPPDYLARVLAAFEEGSGTRSLVLLDGCDPVRSLACGLMDLLLAGGLDIHEALHGSTFEALELARRLERAGLPCAMLDDPEVPITVPEWRIESKLWPGLAAAPPRRRPYRELLDVVAQGYHRMVCPEGVHLLSDRGFDLALHLARNSERTRRDERGIVVMADARPGLVAECTGLRVPAGHLEIIMSFAVDRVVAPDRQAVRLKVVVGGRIRLLRELAADRLTDGFTEHLVVAEAEAPGARGVSLSVRLEHFGHADFAIIGARLVRVEA